MGEPKPWKPGDRVIVHLSKDRYGSGKRWAWFTGTVREVDPPGLRPGVRVDLDQEVNGVRDCYATHRELRPEVPGA
jgi:hypothetical protein